MGAWLSVLLYFLSACDQQASLLHRQDYPIFPEKTLNSLNPEILEKDQTITSRPFQQDELRTYESAWIRLPSFEHIQEPALFLGLCFNIRTVAVGNETIYSSPVLPSRSLEGHNLQTPYLLLPAGSSRPLYIQVVRSLRTGLGFDCRDLAVDSEGNVIRRFLSLQAMELAGGLILFLVGSLAFVTYVLNRRAIALAFAATCLALAGSLLFINHPLHFMYENSQTLFRLWHIFVSSVLAFFLLLIHLALERRFLIILILSACNLAITITHAAVSASGSTYADSFQIVSFFFFSLQNMTIVPFAAGNLFYKKGRAYKTFALAITILSLGFLFDAFGFIFDSRIPMTTCIAALGFLFLSAIALLQQLLDRSKSMEQEHRINLEEYNDQLEAEVGLREQKLKEKNSLLEQSNLELEEKNTLLRLSYKRMDDLRQQQEALLKQAALIKGDVLQDLEGEGLALLAEPNKAHLQRIGVLSHRLSSVLEPFSRLYEDIEAVSNKSIWVMEGKTSAEPFYRHTLGSSKVNLQFFQNEETLMHSLERERPHLLILDADFLEIAAHIHQRYPETPFLISSHGDLSLYIDQLELQTYLNHIFSRDDVDAAFTQRDLLVTATKILSNDLFGLEKYLNWGVDVKEHIITGSLDRLEVLPKLEKDLERAGLPSAMIRAAHRISDELLMNAIYDAPIDRVSGLSRYNHLSRRVNIELEPSEYARLRYAFDGSILAVSIDDPFGGLRRDIILRYLKSCFDGKFGLINETEGKGGGGMGLFQIISTADLLVTNVKPGAKTEVIALLFVHARGTGTRSKGRSFHYFVER